MIDITSYMLRKRFSILDLVVLVLAVDQFLSGNVIFAVILCVVGAVLELFARKYD